MTIKMEDPNLESNPQIQESTKESDEKRMLEIMGEMQRRAEQNEPVDKPLTIDKANYWKIDNLPSKYRLYPENTVIEVKMLSVLNIKKLASMNERNADYIINDILKRCVRGIDINDILLSDKVYILFWLRSNSFRDSRYRVNFRCPKCDTESEYHFDINNLSINYIKDEYEPNKQISLITSKDVITLRYLKIGDEILFEKFKDIYGKLFEEIDDEMLGISFMLDSLNGRKCEDMLERYKYVEMLSPEDFAFILTYIDKWAMGVDPTMNVECMRCGGNVPMGITFRSDFFIPKYSDG